MNRLSPRVLVVDDEAMIRFNLCSFLEDEGFTVFATENGELAFHILEHQQIDVGIIDVRLPDMDGNMFVARAHNLYPNTKFLIHTGSSSYQLPAELTAFGMQPEDVLTKPIVDMTEVAQAILRKMK